MRHINRNVLAVYFITILSTTFGNVVNVPPLEEAPIEESLVQNIEVQEAPSEPLAQNIEVQEAPTELLAQNNDETTTQFGPQLLEEVQNFNAEIVEEEAFLGPITGQNLENSLAYLNDLLEYFKNFPSILQTIRDIIDKLIASYKPGNSNNNGGPVDGANHPCYRKCLYGRTMTCRYDFTLETYQSMSRACYNCPFNMTDCNRKDCIAADGVSKSVTVVNRQLPGPKIEVCLGDTVIVDLHNSLIDGDTTIHWHGHHQKKTPYMDGVPYVTQCPIPVGSSFRYKWVAEHAGTHFWHSHSGMQRTEGDMSAMAIREPRSVHQWLYDHDLSEHVIIVNDWIHEAAIPEFSRRYHNGGPASPTTLLVNGKGRFKQFTNGTTFYTPTARFNVKRGHRYRFRLLNAEFLACPIEVSLQGHDLTIISTDGNDIRPVRASSLVTYAGERFDFIITANQKVGNYWFMFRGLVACVGARAKQVAVLHYDGAPNTEPEVAPSWEESTRPGLQVNSVNKGPGQVGSLAIPELNSIEADDISLKSKADVQFYIAYDFYGKNNTYIHKDPLYGFNQVPVQQRSFTPQFNHITMKMQNFALLPGRNSINPSKHFCNSTTMTDCKNKFCACTHVLNVPLNAVVEIIMVDEGETLDSNHPMHLHGYAFRVVGMGKIGSKTTVEEVKALDAQGKIRRKLKSAPLKDVVTVPDGGYTIVRFYANNPGYWLYHCHIEFHSEVGMALVFKVGEHKDFLPIPKDFPTCGDYIPE